MNFDESVDYLYSLGNEVLAMKLGLENITKLLHALGDPQNKYFKVQVAGTNGKGSTCAFLESICLAAGIRTGMTTSPHLISVTERVRIDGKDISEEDFARFATKIRETSEELVAGGELESVPTYFEQVTAIALLAFAESGCELVILETGLGGRFDATTGAKAEIAVITPIDYDHQSILGNSIEEIAAEKAGIIHENSMVIIAPQRKEAEKVIRQRIAQKGAVEIPIDFDTEIIRTEDRGKYVVNYVSDHGEYRNVELGLRGFHQIDNALTALVIAECITFEFPILEVDFITGLGNAEHRGRLEWAGNFLFDGAHNKAGAGALRIYLDEFAKEPIILIFGAMRDKDLAAIADTLFPVAETIVLTHSANERSLSSRELRKFAPLGIDPDKIIETRSIEEAIRAANAASNGRRIICITGSLYLVGEAQKLLNNR